MRVYGIATLKGLPRPQMDRAKLGKKTKRSERNPFRNPFRVGNYFVLITSR
jgi:hypothetical protein